MTPYRDRLQKGEYAPKKAKASSSAPAKKDDSKAKS